jgi:phytoene synthase
LSRKRNFKLEWVEAFFESMESDLAKKQFETIEGVEEYVYGSAEVVGLMMASIWS